MGISNLLSKEDPSFMRQKEKKSIRVNSDGKLKDITRL